MSDDTPDVPADDTLADDQGSTEPVVPTDPPADVAEPAPVDDAADAERIAALEVHVEELEAALAAADAKLAELEQYIGELEADPYRAPASADSQLGERTPGLDHYESQQLVAEQQAYDRDVQPLIDAGVAVVDTDGQDT